VASVLLLLPLIVSFIFRDGCWLAFLVPGTIMLAGGFLLQMFRPKNSRLYTAEGFVTVSIMWVIFSVVGSLPFLISGSIPSVVDALFETVSGFTTTGSTILTDVECMAPSILFWRSLTHWVGGMGVLALAIALMPNAQQDDSLDNDAVHLLKAETPGPTFGKLVAKLRYNVRILYLIYAGLTVIQTVLMIIGGMPLFDSILTAFGTAGTGGFGIKNSSIAFYDSVYLEVVIGIFMLLFGVNFNIYFFLLTGKLMKILKSEELRWYLSIVAAAVVLITVNIAPMYQNAAEALRYAFFQVASIVTTTGFITENYGLWPLFSQMVLVLLMFTGACASSTAGGLKISRVIIFVKNAVREIRMQIHPREVRVIRCDNEPLPQHIASGVNTYFIIYALTLFASALLISLDGKDFATTVSAAITTLNNVGPGLGECGAVGNFSDFSPLSKLVLTFNMLAGRLELFPLLIALNPSVWKRSI